MPATARIPHVEFRSLLSPPVRVSVNALRLFLRPRCPIAILAAPRLSPCVAQCRALHLYKTAKAKTVLGMHKVIAFSPYEVEDPSTSDHKVNLVISEKNERIIAKDVSLKELYDNHVQTGHMLYLTTALKKKAAETVVALKQKDIPNETRNYAIVKSGTTPASIKHAQKGRQYGALKVLLFNLVSPVSYVKMVLDKAYQFIEFGCPVEIRIRSKSGGTKETKAEKLMPGDSEAWPWLHKHFPHLRPDFILKSMPKDTIYLIKPVTDGRILQFVIAKPTSELTQKDLTKRLFSVKNSVHQSIDSGKQGQLPGLLRKELFEAGNTEYSTKTGMPRSQAVARYGGGSEEAESWGFGESWGSPEASLANGEVSDQRYMVLSSKDNKKMRESLVKWKRRKDTTSKLGVGGVWRLRKPSDGPEDG